jgi:hypothetical protein
MAPKTKDALESWTGFGKQTSEQITERAEAAMGNYFSWFQNAMSASPWGQMELNQKLLSYATETVSASVTFTQRLSQAKDLEDAIKIQMEFVKAQMEVFNQRAKELGEIYTKMVTSAAARPFGTAI